MVWAAIAVIIGQAVIVGVLIKFARTFGSYAAAVMKAHESNTVLYYQAIKILEYTHHVLRDEQEEKSA